MYTYITINMIGLVVPKLNSVFGIVYQDFLIKIFGNQFRYRAGTRYYRTAKVTTTIEHYKE